MSQSTIKLGAVTLTLKSEGTRTLLIQITGEDAPGRLGATNVEVGMERHEWQSLLAVAAVVEAAKEWRERLRARPHATRYVIIRIADNLVAAIDSLPGGAK